MADDLTEKIVGAAKVLLGLYIIVLGITTILYLIFGAVILAILAVALGYISFGTAAAAIATLSGFVGAPIAIAIGIVILGLFYFALGLIDDGLKEALDWHTRFQKGVKKFIENIIEQIGG